MDNLRVIGQIVQSRVVAVIRTHSSQEAMQIAEACFEGGIMALEITFTTPGAPDVIKCLRGKYASGKVVIGAGSVLDSETARIAILAGAEFIVAPSISSATARLCNRYQTPYMPGASTINEVIEAMEIGASIVKVFPGEVLGPAFVKAVHGPLPRAPLMPTGGVTLENARQWLEAGSVALGVGGTLTRAAKNGDFTSVTKLAKEFVAVARSVGKHEACQ